MSVLLTGCGRLPFLGPAAGAEEDWPEIFVFELEPGDLAGNKLEQRIVEVDPVGGDLVPGSARHRATVNTPDGRADFFIARFVNVPDVPSNQATSCTMTQSGSWGSASCGEDPESLELVDGLRERGMSASENWQAVEFSVPNKAVQVAGLTSDGTEYTIIPHAGFGFVQWKSERGFMTLTALDADGDELESITVGMRECELRGRC
ncbi:MAG: hypothetical protein OER95_08465 [Acidimicrobiia bacterium]|nr:hypothetical protein [Acidimicrobiia bacterium]